MPNENQTACKIRNKTFTRTKKNANRNKQKTVFQNQSASKLAEPQSQMTIWQSTITID